MNEVNKRIGFGLLILACVVGAVLMLWPFVPALLWASTFSILLHPFYIRLRDHRKWHPSAAALAATAVPTLLLIVPAVVLGTVAGIQVFDYVSGLIDSAKSGGTETVIVALGTELDKIVKPLLTQLGVTNVNIEQLIVDNQQTIGRNLTGPLSAGIRSFVVTIVTLVISLLTTFFMLRDSHHLQEPVCDLVPLPREETLGILRRMATTVRSVFFAVVVVAIIQATVMGIGFLIAGVEGWLVWTLITAVCCMIPLLGSPMVFIPVGASLLIQGKIWQGCVVLGVGFGIVVNIDNILRPIFISGETKIHAMAIFFALLGGVLLLGPVGLMAGPMLLTLILAFIDVARVKKRLEETDPTPPEPVLEPS